MVLIHELGRSWVHGVNQSPHVTGAFASHCLAPCDLPSLGLGSLAAGLPVAWSLAAPMLPVTFGHSAMGAFQLPWCFHTRYWCPVLCRVLLLSRFLRSCLLVLMQLVGLRLDTLWMSQRWLNGFGFSCVFFCCVLAHFAALCILVFMPLQRSDAFVEADESGADIWIQGFLQPFLVAFFVHLEGDPFTTSVLRYGLAWCCYWVTDRHSFFVGGYHNLKKI